MSEPDTPPATVELPFARGMVRRTDDPDVFAGSLLGAECDCVPLVGTAFGATIHILQLGGLAVQHVKVAPHASRTALASGLALLLVPLRQAGAPPHVNGAPVRLGEALLIPGGVEFHCHSPAWHEWAAVAADPQLLEEWAEVAALPAGTDADVRVLRLPGQTGRHLAETLAAASRLAEALPGSALRADDADGLARSLQDLVGTCLTDGAAARSRPRATREAQRVVLRAEAYLHSRIGRPVHTEELCRAAGVSRRKLHDAFVATVGRSPHAYLKAWRLLLARRFLLRVGGDASLVKTAALSHGFWHGGRFAQDYRRMFGEAPSDTALRARGPAPEETWAAE